MRIYEAGEYNGGAWINFPPNGSGGFTPGVLKSISLEEGFLFPIEPGEYRIVRADWESGTTQTAMIPLTNRNYTFRVEPGEVVYIGDWIVEKTSGDTLGVRTHQNYERRKE